MTELIEAKQKLDKGFVALILRSADQGDGWRKVSKQLEKFVMGKVGEAPDLFQVQTDNDDVQIRLSPEGEIAAKWM